MVGWRHWAPLCALAACRLGGGEAEPDGPDCYVDPGGCIDPAGLHYQFVVDSMKLPASAMEAQALAFDVDGHPDGRVDNALGQILSTLEAQGGDEWPVQQGILLGTTITLIDVQAVDPLIASGVGVRVLIGSDSMPAPCTDASDDVCGRHLNGDGHFSASTWSQDDAAIVGELNDGLLRGGPGRALVQLLLPHGVVMSLPLIGARIDVTMTADGLVEGRLGGALSTDDYGEYLIPAVVDTLIREPSDACQLIGYEHPCCPPAPPCDAYFCPAFDCPDVLTLSCEISRTAVVRCFEQSDLVMSLLSPDVDLLDESGAFNPNQDEVKDALSFAVGFTAVGASFEVPQEAP